MHSKKLSSMTPHLLLLFFSSLTVGFASASASENLSTPKSNQIGYWNKEVQNYNAKPTFLLSKTSPLSTADTARFSKLASQNALSSHFPEFCASANLFCYPDSTPGIDQVIADQVIANSSVGGIDQVIANSSVGGTDQVIANSSVGGTDQVIANSSVGGTDQVIANSSVGGRVKQGRFFRESMLKEGKVVPMPDTKDKTPERSFLPRTILSKLPFSTSKISELKKIFHADDNSTMETMMMKTLNECESAPIPGETKRCVGTAEDMIDFAISVLGQNIVLHSTKEVKRLKLNIMIGSVKGLNGGKVMQVVSCHQALFPYLLYACHSVPKARVYEVDILDPNSKAKINHGIANCDLHTSNSNPNHAELTIASGPGQIRACHWLFENDLIWTVAN